MATKTPPTPKTSPPLEVTIRKICSRWDAEKVLWEGEATTVRDALQQAVRRGADLGGANLGDANLRGADLGGAKNVRLPTGETFDEYLREVVPALLTAGGQPLESFAEHFQCHDWTNCPMHHAFNAESLQGVPILLRPRVEQFIQLFDAKQIPWPLPVAVTSSETV